jgi:hypothetical protein
VSEVLRDQTADTAAEVAELGLHPADEHDAEFPVRGTGKVTWQPT